MIKGDIRSSKIKDKRITDFMNILDNIYGVSFDGKVYYFQFGEFYIYLEFPIDVSFEEFIKTIVRDIYVRGYKNATERIEGEFYNVLHDMNETIDDQADKLFEITN